jgi:cyclophilin family peptidyl-prolyl cis-trans isomerase
MVKEQEHRGGALRRRGLSLGLPLSCAVTTIADWRPDHASQALAEEAPDEAAAPAETQAETQEIADSPSTSTSTGATRVYLDIEVDNESFGSVVVELDSDKAPNGAKRFLELATGELSCMKLPNALLAGTKFDYIDDFSLRNSGPTQTRLKATSFKCDEQVGSASKAASVRTLLEKELEVQAAGQGRSHVDETAPVVSILVRDIDDSTPAPAKLISKNGKLEFVEDTPRADLMPSAPSGTSFQISVASQAAQSQQRLRSLDQTHLVVGLVVEGLDVIQRLKGLPYNRDNSDNAFFKAGKNAGDKRALVAAKAFNRPFARIIVTQAGRK